MSGKATSPAPTKLQNTVKNNFCSPPGPAEVFTPQKLIDLQAQTPITGGSGHEPADRTALKALGEGKTIVLEAFIIEAHHADVGTGESVNCNGLTEEDNDIHIALGPSAGSMECGSVTAEISPHQRPATWNEIGHFEIFNVRTQKYAVNTGIASRLQAQPLRFTGQLFFDSSHTPCPCGASCTPSRSSLWEMHPVYKIDVCRIGTTVPASCDVNNDNDWIPFDSWWKNLAPIPKPKPPHAHPSHEKSKP